MMHRPALRPLIRNSCNPCLHVCTCGILENSCSAGPEEAGRKFKGKTMSRLMKYKAGNYARDFFKHVKVPCAAWCQVSARAKVVKSQCVRHTSAAEVPTMITVPIYEVASDGSKYEATAEVPVLDIHELLDYLYTEVGIPFGGLQALLGPHEKP